MPDFPIIDTHLHVWDHERLRYYAWIKGNPLFDQPYHVEDYARDLRRASRSRRWSSSNAMPIRRRAAGSISRRSNSSRTRPKRDPRLKAIVPMAPLERGKRRRADPRGDGRQASDGPRHPPHRRVRRRSARADAQRRLHRRREPARKVRHALRDQRQLHPDGHRPRIRASASRRADDPRPLRQAGHQRGRHRAVPRRRRRARAAPEPLDQALRPAGRGRPRRIGPKPTCAPISTRRSTPSAPTARSMPATIRSACRRRRCRAGSRCSTARFADLGSARPRLRKIYRDNANAFYRLGL